MKYFPCPETGCGEPALIESLAAEEFMVCRDEELTRKPLALQRIFWGTCPVHGRVMGLQSGPYDHSARNLETPRRK